VKRTVLSDIMDTLFDMERKERQKALAVPQQVVKVRNDTAAKSTFFDWWGNNTTRSYGEVRSRSTPEPVQFSAPIESQEKQKPWYWPPSFSQTSFKSPVESEPEKNQMGKRERRDDMPTDEACRDPHQEKRANTNDN